VNEPGLLRGVRLGALVVGAACLLYAMVLAPEQTRSRDIAWSVGVAALVLSLVANWLLRRATAEPPSRVDRTGDSR
jgi:multisubunit Na+/H+ antiporter MnhB subunit